MAIPTAMVEDEMPNAMGIPTAIPMPIVLRQVGIALEQLISKTVIDEANVTGFINDIGSILKKSVADEHRMANMQFNLKKFIGDRSRSPSRSEIIEAVVDELCTLLVGGNSSFTPVKGNTSVVTFIGKQGSGKTTTATKYAYYHNKKGGYKPALVCADTSGAADAFDRSMTRAKIPVHGSLHGHDHGSELNPIGIATEGIEKFKKSNRNLIIVDACGNQENHLAESHLVCEATKPDLIILVTSSHDHIVSAAQLEEFKSVVPVGAIIITRIDTFAHRCDILPLIAKTKCPVMYIGTGEGINHFAVFDPKPVVKHLSGMGQMLLLHRLSEGKFTLGDMHETIDSVIDRGEQVLFELPEYWRPECGMVKLKRRRAMFQSMTKEELGRSILEHMEESRMSRIARGSGNDIKDVREMLLVCSRLRVEHLG